MSRIGKLKINIPTNVTVTLNPDWVDVTGPLGELSTKLSPVVSVKLENDQISVERLDDSLIARSAHGLMRQLIANLVTGVTEGFEKKLELKGVGYRAATQGDTKLTLSLGFSHPVEFTAPDGITFKVEKNIITISGNDKQLVGEITAQIRRVRPPEPYKGKGVLYLGEKVRRKAGKAAKAGA